jgi:hypothetical protein
MKARKLLSLLLCLILIFAMLPGGAASGGASSGAPAKNSGAKNEYVNPFGDVKPGDWFYDDVAFVFSSGLMSGTGTDSPLFSPGMTMSRAMLITVLYRLAGSPDASGLSGVFSDVPEDAWYRPAVAWAAANGIAVGVGGSLFEPNGSVTREQAATILLRYARLTGKADAFRASEDIAFDDADSISDWALEGVRWCCAAGVLAGKPGDKGLLFDPRGNATRAELAAMVHRFAEKVAGVEPDKSPTESRPLQVLLPATYLPVVRP